MSCFHFVTPPSPYITLTLHYHHGFSHNFFSQPLGCIFLGFSTITHVIEICQPQMVFDMSEVGRPSNQAVSGNILECFSVTSELVKTPLPVEHDNSR